MLSAGYVKRWDLLTFISKDGKFGGREEVLF